MTQLEPSEPRYNFSFAQPDTRIDQNTSSDHNNSNSSALINFGNGSSKFGGGGVLSEDSNGLVPMSPAWQKLQ